MNSYVLNLKFTPTIKGVFVFYVPILLTILLLLGKLNAHLMIPLPSIHTKEFYSHISNFIISYNIVAIISFIWLIQGIRFQYIIGLGIAAIAVNFIVEILVTIANTPDVIDAVYGLIGIVFALLTSYLIKKGGLRPYKQNG